MSAILTPFQLLELNLISAQDLANVSRSMRTYAVAWVHPDRKLSTRVDTQGDNNPTWNDKFVFRVDDEFLYSDTSAIMVEIYTLHWFRDVHVGTVRVLVGNILPNTPRAFRQRNYQSPAGMRFVALQVRRPSGRPQGILNIGVGVLNSSMRSMPLYTQLNSSGAVGYRHLMGEDDSHLQGNGSIQTAVSKPSGLRRTKSDTSSMIRSELRASELRGVPKKEKPSSTVNGSDVGPKKKKFWSRASNSLLSGSDVGNGKKRKNKSTKKSRPSSVISGSEVSGYVSVKEKTGKSSSIVSGSEVSRDPPPKKGYKKTGKGKPSSVQSDSEAAPEVDPPTKRVVLNEKPIRQTDNWSESEVDTPKVRLSTLEKAGFYMDFENPRKSRMTPMHANATPMPVRMTPLHTRGTPKHPRLIQVHPRATPIRTKSFHKFNGLLEYGTPRRSALMDYNITPRKSVLPNTRVFLTESELGPSPSEVAAEMAKVQRLDEEGSSLVGGASMDESVEGLQSKLERWRTELPPVYDQGEFSSVMSSKNHEHEQHKPDGGNGLFSCFSNICGCQCQIVCGGDSANKPSNKVGSGRIHRRNASSEKVSFV
ncbi:hypothetical protein F2P56_015815 [Juglans regia]|uniref:C2 domain-containing protein n=2 Tax=Juglans regia TaxID=51240 RepID=A0A833XG52_JUGRE|nr:uncharacterized protein LOC108990559 [Juglans regia]KAF5465848.1 hypothetical protein F2P56_015815 [Juglans regia]